MKRKYIIQKISILVCVLMMFFSIQAVAHQKASEHNQELEKVLLGEGYPKRINAKASNSITALEEASRLTIDQYEGNLQNSLDILNNMRTPRIKGVPKDISEIDYSEQLDIPGKKVNANVHRKYTHQGWGRVYQTKRTKKFWDKRREVLLDTVNSVFNFGIGSSITIFGYDKKCDSLCAIIYYVHLLGDYDEADSSKKITLLAPLAGIKEIDKQTDEDALGMIPELEAAIEVLFEGEDYDGLIKELERIYKKARKLEPTVSEEEFDEYKKCSEEIMKALQKEMPDLLKTQEFFTDVFPIAN